MKTTTKIISSTTAAAMALAMSAATSFAGTTVSTEGSPIATTTEPSTGGFKFQIGLTYVNLSKLKNAIEDNNPNYSVDTIWPVGISFNPYYEFNNGLAIGLEVGPGVWATGDASFYLIPVGADVRYTFMRDKAVSPYVRAGIQYIFAGGDFVDSSGVGFYGKVGLEFKHSSRVSWGLEAGYSSTGVDVLAGGGHDTKTVKPYEFTAGVFVRF